MQFVLFLIVLVLVARVSRNDDGSSGESFQFAPRIAAVPERLREIWWVAACRSSSRCSRWSPRSILPLLSDKSERHQTWADDHRLRALRGVGHRAHRLGRSAVARPDGVRRARRAHRGRADPRAVSSTSAGTARASSTAAIGGIPFLVGDAARRVRSRAWSRSWSASARCASRGCCSRSARWRSRSRRRRTSSTGRSSPPAAPTVADPARPTSARSTSRTGTARTTTSCSFVLVVVLAARRAPPPHRHRPHDHRRARERARGRGA